MSQAPTLSYWLAAMLLPEIGPRSVLRWLDSFCDPEKLFTASTEAWRTAGIAEKYFSALQQPDWKSVEKALAWSEVDDHHLICFSDSNYPALLKEIPDPPLVLYVWGDKTVLHKQQIGMVGARHATPMGLRDAEQFAFHLAEAGLAVTSGLALGIDGASHRGALAAKGVTIGVMGTGLNHIYPERHQPLARDIVQQGRALISEFPLDVAPKAQNFPRRNRVISGLSLGVLVVEAAIKSGSLITARYAMEQNREVFAIPGSIHNPLSRGCHHLIRQGAKLTETAQDVIEELKSISEASLLAGKRGSCFFDGAAPAIGGHIPVPDGPKSKNAASQRVFLSPLSDCLRQLLEQVDYAITPFDVIVLRSGLTVGEVSSMLLSLTLEGYVKSVVGGYMRMASDN